MCSYIRNGVGSDWFSENVMLAEKVSGAWRTWKQEGQKGSSYQVVAPGDSGPGK